MMDQETKTLEVRKKKGKIREYVEALLTALLIAFVIRSFVIEAFKIPSGSMIPTLMIGDHIFVNKFIYGLRIPFTKKKIVEFGIPKRGEAIVFIYPIDESKDFIKRVVGLPGDKIKIEGDNLFVNGEEVEREELQVEPNDEGRPTLLKVIPEAFAHKVNIEAISAFHGWEDYKYYLEDLTGYKHLVQFDSRPSFENAELEVPSDRLFVMGDNRDNSADSREWGFVPIENVKGKAMFVWLSIDYERKTIRWDRFGRWIK